MWETWPRRTASKSKRLSPTKHGLVVHTARSERAGNKNMHQTVWVKYRRLSKGPSDWPSTERTDKTPRSRAYKQPGQMVIVFIETKTWKKHTVVTVISLILRDSKVQTHGYTASLSVKLMLTWLIQWVNSNTSCIKTEECDRRYAVVVLFTSTSSDDVAD